MTIRISLLLPCRIAGNNNSRLLNLMRSLCEKLSDKKIVELLVRFDNDDPDAPAAIESLKPYEERLNIRTFISARAGGYRDLHKLHYDSFLQTAITSEISWVITDDIEIFYSGEGSWDEYVASKLDEQTNPVFTFHTFHQVRPYHQRTAMETVESPDSYPIWSKHWILSQGGLGPVYSTDGWTALVERYLKLHYDFDNRVHLEKLSIHRHIVESDGPGNERYDVLRRETLDRMTGEFLTELVAANARGIYNGYLSFSPEGRQAENAHRMASAQRAARYRLERMLSYPATKLNRAYWLTRRFAALSLRRAGLRK